jgi:glucose-1-phosphate thymidylyltransferase
MNKNGINRREVIGLIPAAGKSTRISPLPCSKELYPVGFRTIDNHKGLRPKVVSHYLLEKMHLAGIQKAYVILRDGKWDIPSYFGDGKLLDMHLAYLMMGLSYGVPYTLDQAYPFVKDSIIALGFPDILFQPENAYLKVLSKLKDYKADAVLGLFPADQPQKTDMVEVDDNGLVRSIHIKTDQTELYYAWEIAVWTPAFTNYMHNYVLSLQESHVKSSSSDLKDPRELFVGDVIQAAIKDNMKVDSVTFKDGACLDIGTPEDLVRAVQPSNGYL